MPRHAHKILFSSPLPTMTDDAERVSFDRPLAMECPCDGFEYDCGKRAPMRSPCACRRLMCRKCAGVVASLPGPAPCGLCGADAVGPFDMTDFVRDTGTMAALLAMKTKTEVVVEAKCAECAALGFDFVAKYTCMDDGCALKALCSGHAMAHKQWGHGITVDNGEESAAVFFGISHCPKPEHAGAEGELTHHCRQCAALVCRSCADEHLDLKHDLFSMAKAASHASEGLRVAMPTLSEGLEFQRGERTSLARVKAALESNLHSALGELVEAAEHMHAQVEAMHAIMVRQVQDLYAEKVADIGRCERSAHSAIADMETVTKVVETALASLPEDPLRVLAAETVAISQPVVGFKRGHGIDPALRVSPLSRQFCFGEEEEVMDDALERQVLMMDAPTRQVLMALDSFCLKRDGEKKRQGQKRLVHALWAAPFAVHVLDTYGFEDPAIMYSALRILWNLAYAATYSNVDDTTFIASVPLVLRAMQVPGAALRIVRTCIGIFRNLALLTSRVKDLLRHSELQKLVVEAKKAHDDEDLHKAADSMLEFFRQ